MIVGDFMIGLKHPYISVALSSGESFGGGQQFSKDAMIRRCGCGVIAAADALLYLSRWHSYGAVDYFAGFWKTSLFPSPSTITAYEALTVAISQ